MEQALKIGSWFFIVLGSLVLLDSFIEFNPLMALVAFMYVLQGVMTLTYIKANLRKDSYGKTN